MDISEKIDAQIKKTLSAIKVPIKVGDLAPDFTLYDEHGRSFNSADDYLSGRPLIAVFVPGDLSEKIEAELRAFAVLADRMEQYGINAILISLQMDNAKLLDQKRQLAWPGPAISDPTGRVFALYGLVKDTEFSGEAAMRSVVITAQRRVGAIYDKETQSDHAKRALETVLRTSAVEQNFVADHAPVLIVPNVFSEEECRELIGYYERESHPIDFDRNNPAARSIDTKLPMWEHNRQDRIDLVVKHPDTLKIMDQRIFGLVVPQVKKAFGYQVNKRESVNIARYEGTRSGIEMGHRDNVQPEVSHRRFALTIALNNDFEGGEIIFREFANHGYRGAPGTAFVFSSALLHEVLETTRGQRYVIISHLFSDVAQK